MSKSLNIERQIARLKDQQAVARLIETAPDMLALLVESQDGIGGDWRDRRDAVVAKALGERG